VIHDPDYRGKLSPGIQYDSNQKVMVVLSVVVREIVSKDTKERLDKIVSSGSGAGEGVVKNYSAVAIFSMQLGLVLLCVAAIKFFLASPTAQAIPTPLHLL